MQESKIIKQLRRAQKLLRASLFEPSVYIVYTYYLLRDGEPTSLRQSTEATGYAQPTIAYSRKVLTTLGLLRIEKVGRGKTSTPHILETPIKVDDTIRGQLEQIKQERDRYHPMRYKTGKVSNQDLQSLIKWIPKEHQGFSKTPAKLTALSKLAGEVDLEQYTKWFLKHKLGKTVEGFNLGIFTFKGIVDEFKRSRVKVKKKEAYTNVRKRRDVFKEKADKFKEEMEGGK